MYNALDRPRTSRQILRIAQQFAPKITYHDLRPILRSFEEAGWVVCLNPQEHSGRLYVLASEKDKYTLSFPQIQLQAKLLRGKLRLAVLEEIGRNHAFACRPLTATHIRKNLLEKYPMGMNNVLDALKFLRQESLIRIIGYTDKRDLKIYALTELGRKTLQFIQVSEMNSSQRLPL